MVTDFILFFTVAPHTPLTAGMLLIVNDKRLPANVIYQRTDSETANLSFHDNSYFNVKQKRKTRAMIKKKSSET